VQAVAGSLADASVTWRQQQQQPF